MRYGLARVIGCQACIGVLFVRIMQRAVILAGAVHAQNIVVDGLAHLEDAAPTKVLTMRPYIDHYEAGAAETY